MYLISLTYIHNVYVFSSWCYVKVQTNMPVRAVIDIFQMMMMMMREHTWSWASEPAGCIVYPRAVNHLPWGSTALLTPPSAVICDSSQQNWLSGPGYYITHHVLIADYIQIDTDKWQCSVWTPQLLTSTPLFTLLTPVCVKLQHEFLQFQKKV